MNDSFFIYATSLAPTLSTFVGSLRFAYRSIGDKCGVPVVFLNRYRASMDDWDPALIDIVATERRVILFDYPGVGYSAGSPCASVLSQAKSTCSFIKSLDLNCVDLVGFSYGGVIAQHIVEEERELVRRLVLASSGPPQTRNTSSEIRARTILEQNSFSQDDLLYLLFSDTDTSRKLGLSSLERLKQRARKITKAFPFPLGPNPARSVRGFNEPSRNILRRLIESNIPVLVAAGSNARITPTLHSYILAKSLMNAKLVVYPDAGDGFLFQYPQPVGWEILRFLED